MLCRFCQERAYQEVSDNDTVVSNIGHQAQVLRSIGQFYLTPLAIVRPAAQSGSPAPKRAGHRADGPDDPEPYAD